jgi:hypothetical protein
MTVVPTAAHAEDSPFCRKVRARAASDAALLFSPSIQAQGIRFPRNGTTDSGITTGAGYQFRAGATFSPLDFYKGIRVKGVGEADCAAHEQAVTIREILLAGADYGRLPALEKKIAFIDEHRSELDAATQKTDERIGAHVASIRDAAEVRLRVSAIRRAREQAQGDVDRLRARGIGEFRGSLSALVVTAEQQAMKFEREVSHVRTLDAWDVRVSGGVIPQDTPMDYFGMVQVGFNFGAFSRNAQENRYLEARSDELKRERYELREAVASFESEVASAAAQAKRELAIVEAQALSIAKDKSVVAGADGGAQALTLLTLDGILVESERVQLEALVFELARLETDHGH